MAKAANGNNSISKIVLEHILVLAVAQEQNRDETKPKVVNAVTLEVTPEQAEKLDLARSVGSLSLVLRNQIDSSLAATSGSTKKDLLNGDTQPATLPVATDAKSEVAAAKPVVKKVVRRKAVAKAAEPYEQVEVVRGNVTSVEKF
jgi:pilus assembly protein CpaB